METQDHGQRLVGIESMKTQDSVDKLTNKLVALPTQLYSLVDMALTTLSLHHTDLDTTRLVQTQSS